VVKENGKSAKSLFIFASLDGTISAWNPNVDGVVTDPVTHVSSSHTTIMADRSDFGATYTGCDCGKCAGRIFPFRGGWRTEPCVDIFDSNFNFVRSFSDPAIPRNFTTYGIQTINGQLWVTYTPLNKALGGFVDVFATDGTLLRHNALHGRCIRRGHRAGAIGFWADERRDFDQQ